MDRGQLPLASLEDALPVRMHQDPSSTGLREDAIKSIKNLGHFGIVPAGPDPDADSKKDEGLALSRFIASSLLNFSILCGGKQACPYTFVINPGQGSTVKIPPRSNLLLHFIAHKLHVNIFIFSTRSNPISITPQYATHSVAFLHRVDSITTASEFMVLRASLFAPTTNPGPRRLALPFTSEFNPAILRKDQRITERHGKRGCGELDDSEVQSTYKKSCIATITSHASLSIGKREDKEVSKNKLFRGEGRKLGEEGTVGSWNNLVTTSFDGIWDSETARISKRVKGKGRTDEDGDADDRDDNEINLDGGVKPKARSLRTCTSTLNQIIRPDVAETGDDTRILELLERSRQDITVVIEELSVLALKATHVIAGGQLYKEIPGLNDRTQSTKALPSSTCRAYETFDIRRLLPYGFKPRDETVLPELQVAPLPSNLQDHIAANMEKKTRKDDITNLLSFGHLKSMYARFLSSSQKGLTASNEHLVWHKTEDMIRSSSVMNDLPKAPEGISTTIYAYIQEFATNIKNHWESPGYDKLLDYLMRILSRLHLAPLREQKTKDRSTGKLKQTQEWMRRRPDEQRERISKILGQLHVLGSTGSDVKENPIATSETHPASIVDEPDSIDMDWELYWDLEEEEQEEDQMDGGDSDGTKEPSRAHLKSLQGLLKVLLESPTLSDRKINGNYVKKSAFVGNKFTTKECDVVAKIVNILRPFAPKRHSPRLYMSR
ncbi:hypothetical protein B0O80DRAFT_492326 [Mortierella sp. GBAus27b]|nr:hypothetical protein B0O80DRAFT_492326 [Mortierella sp. GBAus27b]